MTRAGQRRVRVGHATAPWIHMGILVGLGFVGLLALHSPLCGGYSAGTREGFGAVLRSTAYDLYAFLPAMAGLAMTGGRVGRGWLRTGFWIVAATILTMVILDVSVSDEGGGRAPAESAIFEGGAMATIQPNHTSSEPGIRAIIDLSMNSWTEVGEVRETYSPEHPRRMFLSAYLRTLLLLMPLVAVGLVVGLRSWVLNHVIFRRPRDERVATLVLAWVTVPAACWMGFALSWQMAGGVLRGSLGVLMPVLAYAPFLLVAGTGWRAGWRITKAGGAEAVIQAHSD